MPTRPGTWAASRPRLPDEFRSEMNREPHDISGSTGVPSSMPTVLMRPPSDALITLDTRFNHRWRSVARIQSQLQQSQLNAWKTSAIALPTVKLKLIQVRAL